MGVNGVIFVLLTDGNDVAHVAEAKDSRGNSRYDIPRILNQIQLVKTGADLLRNGGIQNPRRPVGKGFDPIAEIGASKPHGFMKQNGKGGSVAVTYRNGAVDILGIHVRLEIGKGAFEDLEKSCVTKPDGIHIVVWSNAEIEVVDPILVAVAGLEEQAERSVVDLRMKAGGVFYRSIVFVKAFEEQISKDFVGHNISFRD